MFKALAAISAGVLFVSTASADLVNPDIPTWRGDAGTGFAQWDSFTSADGGANAPEQGGGFNVFNFGPGAIIAGSGNLYAAGGPLNIHVYQAGPPIFGLSEAVLNMSFAGNPIDTDNVRAYVGSQASGTYVDGIAEFRGGGGSSFSPQTWAITFDLSAFSGGMNALSFFFDSAGESNSSLDALSIDYNTIPAPGALFAMGLLGVTRRRRG
jgi:hypothetical protein